MAVNLSPIWGAGAQLFDNSGNVLSGGKIYTYAAGTTTPATTYTSSNGITANSNPIILNSAGRVPYEIWLTDTLAYKFVLKDSNDTLIATYDNLVGINSNFIAYTAQQEIQTATAGQTVFNLTTMQYQPATNNLSVFVDGVNQYGPGAQYAYVETDSDTVTFVSGLHVGASVKFTTASPVSSSSTNAENVAYDPPFTGAVGTNVEAKLAQTVSVKDFGAVGDGVTDDSQSFIDAIAALPSDGGAILVPDGIYYLTNTDLQAILNNPPVAFGTKSITWNISSGAVFNGTAKFPNMTTNNACFANGQYTYQQKASGVTGSTIDATFAQTIESIQPSTATDIGYGALFLGAQLNATGNASINTALNALATANAGSSGNIWGIEINVASFAGSNVGNQFGLSITGLGGHVTFGIKIDRADSVSRYEYGIQIRRAYRGLFVENTPNTLWGAAFGNFESGFHNGNMVMIQQIDNNAANSALILQRYTDTTSAGYFVNCINKAATQQYFSVDTQGNVYGKKLLSETYTATTAANAVAAGSVQFGAQTSSTATSGGATLPSQPLGFLVAYHGSTQIKIPYYNA